MAVYPPPCFFTSGPTLIPSFFWYRALPFLLKLITPRRPPQLARCTYPKVPPEALSPLSFRSHLNLSLTFVDFSCSHNQTAGGRVFNYSSPSFFYWYQKFVFFFPRSFGGLPPPIGAPVALFFGYFWLFSLLPASLVSFNRFLPFRWSRLARAALCFLREHPAISLAMISSHCPKSWRRPTSIRRCFTIAWKPLCLHRRGLLVFFFSGIFSREAFVPGLAL